MSSSVSEVQILGIRGLPAQHGGFETFVGWLAPYLVSKGWRVTVYCQQTENVPGPAEWKGVHLVHIPSKSGSLGSLAFDWRALGRAATLPGPALVFGYNTAVLNERLRLHRKKFAVNMDGVEWRRAKWGPIARVVFLINEIWAARRSTQLIADHPEILRHLRRWRGKSPITMIPYGAEKCLDLGDSCLRTYGLSSNEFATIIARPEPENSILEMVRAFSVRERGRKLVVLGQYDKSVKYQAQVLAAASREVLFLGPVYDPETVATLRFHSAFYMYGHVVGGTSPTLVEALAAGCPALCLDTPYARWVVDDAGLYFLTEIDCDVAISKLFSVDRDARERLRKTSHERHERDFTWPRVLAAYEQLLEGIDS